MSRKQIQESKLKTQKGITGKVKTRRKLPTKRQKRFVRDLNLPYSPRMDYFQVAKMIQMKINGFDFDQHLPNHLYIKDNVKCSVLFKLLDSYRGF